MSKILIKNNKGGVGKSWLTLQLAHGLAKLGFKVLIVTSDSQNDILGFLGIDTPTKRGLEDWVQKGEGELIRLRDNLFYIPLMTNVFSKSFKEKLKARLNRFGEEYDFLLIDSVPVMGIDKEFEEVADKIIIPTFADNVTCNGVEKMIDNIEDIRKIKAIVPNRFLGSSDEKLILSKLKNSLMASDIFLSDPIRHKAIITRLNSKYKTIWDSESKEIKQIQEIVGSILEVMLDEQYS
ncbi:ParA family protein [Cetobacterium sp.]|uniref:ParA family protein n=1 Tax=Cetobacterium sp. TaxID=2071632 RepID=UPI003F3A4623